MIQSMLPNASVYTDFNSLESLKNINPEQKNQGTFAAAKQFEGLFLQMVLKSMRESNNVLKSDLLDSHEGEMYEEMYHQQLALHLSEQGGVGLAEVIARQLDPDHHASSVEIPPMTPWVKGMNEPPRSYDVSKGSSGFNINFYLHHESSGLPIKNFSQGIPHSIVAPEKPSEKSLSKVEIPSVLNSPEEFLQILMPYAQKASERLGVDPKVLLSQAALETGWGKSLSSQKDPHFNIFGIKTGSEWSGPSVKQLTHEYESGQRQLTQADFRKYDWIEDSFTDYADHLMSYPRYQKALEVAHDPNQFIEHLQKSGYATDPRYAEKIKNIFWSPTVQQL